jgi:hypothetical protein
MLAHHIRFYLSPHTAERPPRGGDPARRAHERGAQMSEKSTVDEAGRYEIRLKGHLDSRWAEWFDGLSLTNSSDGTTVIHGFVLDQAALHGLLRKVRDIGLQLISVTRVEPDQPAVPTARPTDSPTQQRKTT